MLRHDELGQETLLNLLLRNYLSANLYDQVRSLWVTARCWVQSQGSSATLSLKESCTTEQRAFHMLLRQPMV